MKITNAVLSFLALCIFYGCQDKTPVPEPCYPIPTEKQLAWHELEMYAFVHFTTNTFTNKEWGFGDESPEIFNPTELDCHQWARIVKDAGLKGIILTAKHHDGFCLWPSKYTDHSVEKSLWKNGKGDVVRELSEACKEYGIKFGLYLSPWDRNHPEYGKEEYVTYFRNQLHELLTNYGEVFEMWFDGANGGTGYYGGANEHRKINTLVYYDWDETYKKIYEWSPNTLVWGVGPSEARWIGNEHGEANATNWSMLRQKDELAGKVHYKEFMSGHEDGERWVPGEADVSIRPGWFYHQAEDKRVKTVEHLMDIYYKSVGRNATLLLNLPVDRRGLVHEIDEARLKAWSEQIKADFRTELLSEVKVKATNERGNSRTYSAKNVLDGDKTTYWATDDSIMAASLTFEFDKPTNINRILLQEYIALGQRVREFNVEARVGGSWITIANETTIGYKRILRIDRVEVTALRINITDSRACPLIATIEAFNAPILVNAPSIKRNKDGLVSMNSEDTFQIFYTLDGSEPTSNSLKYDEAFIHAKDVEIRAIAYCPVENQKSEVIVAKFGKSKALWNVIEINRKKTDEAGKIVDADLETVWTSQNNNLPVSVVIDMGEIQMIKGFSYMPPQAGYDLISTYEFFTSTNAKEWFKQSEGEFSNIINNPVLQEKLFKSVEAKYLKFVAKAGVKEESNISIGEIGVVY